MPKSSTTAATATATATATAISAVESSSNNNRPKTVLDKIVHAIRQQPKTPNGVSRIAISKYIKAELEYDNAPQIKKALKKGVDTNILEQHGQSFRVKADPIGIIAEPLDERVEITDLILGKGDIITERGDSVTVKYVGKLCDGAMFDAESSFEFTLGAGDVIKGWDLGALVGMKVGGKRKLVVPPKLGYGKRGCGPDIPPNSELHFEITLKKLTRGAGVGVGGTSASPSLVS